MPSSIEQICMEDISRIVLDKNSKISANFLSCKHDIALKDSSALMEQWLGQYEGKCTFAREYLIRGLDNNKNSIIALVPEENLKDLEAKYVRIKKWLYFLQTTSNSKLPDVQYGEEILFKTLKIAVEKRDIDSMIFPSDEEKPNMRSKLNSNQESNENEVVNKEVPTSKTLHSMFKKSKVKEEKPSPEHLVEEILSVKSPKKEPSPPKKNAKKQPNTKGSIASFFKNSQSSKIKPSSTPLPSTSNQEEDTHTPIKDHPINVEKPGSPHKDEKKNRKRTISDESDDSEVVPETPQERKNKLNKSKKPTMKTVKRKENPNKKTRLMQIVDSSESDSEQDQEEGTKEKLIDVDSDVEMDEVKKESSPNEKKESSPNENDSSHVNRAKIRKEVTKTFVDDEGYLTTIKEYEMVDASETEDVSEKEEKEKIISKDVKKESKKPNLSSPATKNKQGSITSFFTKK